MGTCPKASQSGWLPMAFRCSSAFIVESLTQELAVSYGFLGENRPWENPGCHMLPLTHLDTCYIVLPQCQTTNGAGVKLSYDLWHSYLPQIFTATFNHNQLYELCRSRLRFVITPRALYLQPSSGLSKPKELDQTWPKGPIIIPAWSSYAEWNWHELYIMNYLQHTAAYPPKKKRPSLHVLTRPRCRNLSARWFREQGMEISKIFLAARLGDNVALFLMPEQQCTNDLHTFYYWKYVCM